MKQFFSRIWALTIKEFIHLRNDWWMPAFMLFGGALELLLVGWATSRPIVNLPLMILDQDQTPASRQVITALENTGTFDLPAENFVSDFSSIEEAMQKGKITAAVIFPTGFGNEMTATNGRPTLSVILNGAESTPATAALRAVDGVSRDISEKILLNRLNINQERRGSFMFDHINRSSEGHRRGDDFIAGANFQSGERNM